MGGLPIGTVTFFFADIEGSTRLLQQLGDGHARLLAHYRRIIRDALGEHHGHEIDTPGEGFFAVFRQAADALRAAVSVQRAATNAAWPDGVSVRVRIGIHSGEAVQADSSYVGLDVHRTARICDAAHGGQVLVSRATRDLIEDALIPGVSLGDLGEHRLRDLPRPERLYQLLHPELPAEFPPPRSLGARPHNLPRQLTSFIGRERELAEARRLLSTVYLLTLTGPGGGGKTRLALRLAADLVREFRDGVWLVELTAVADPGTLPQAVASALRVREQPGRSFEATLGDYLRSRHLLLILDGCEHVIDACAALAEGLLRVSPDLRIIATSRQPLHIAGETVLRVPSLSIPDPRRRMTLDAVQHSEAVRLFADRAAAAQPGFALTEQNAAVVAQICRRLDGIPLAIELAAARMTVLPIDEIAARLDDRFRLLSGGSRTAARRQQTLRAAMDWSYDVLTAQEQLLFRRLAVFVGGFTLDAAEAVCGGDGCDAGQVLDVLARLVDQSLVTSSTHEFAGGEARFGMLETVRQYAAEALEQSGDAPAVRRRHLAYYLGMVERGEPALRGPQQQRWLAVLEQEHDNIRAAIRWAEDDDHSGGAGLRLAGALRWFWFTRGYVNEGRQTLERALALAGGGSASERAWALSAAALLAWRQRDYEAAAQLARQSEALGRGSGDDRALAYALNVLGLVARDQGDLDRAGALHRETRALFVTAADRWGEALSLQNLAYVAHRRGDYERAEASAEEALTIFRDVQDRRGIATTLYILGRMALRQGRDDRAVVVFDEAMQHFRDLGDRALIGFAMISQGQLARRRQENDKAQALLEEALGLMRDLGDKRGIADASGGLGALAADRDDHAAAAAMYHESLALDVELGNRQGIAEGLERLSRVALAQGRPEHAVILLGAAEALRAHTGMPLPEADRDAVNRVIAAARDAMGITAFDAAWSRGRTIPLSEALAVARGGTALSSPTGPAAT
jgi:predicted ATPase/class 3 adenylate cyclase